MINKNKLYLFGFQQTTKLVCFANSNASPKPPKSFLESKVLMISPGSTGPICKRGSCAFFEGFLIKKKDRNHGYPKKDITGLG